LWRASGFPAVEEPSVIYEALVIPHAEELRHAMTEEMTSLMKKGTWELLAT
jgi:hypothetical protein